MAQNTRQTKLFAAEDYTVVYESYINANFQAYDYDTIRTSMVDYVRNNYPENYNDWIESAEFVAILDVVAQFGHNLAYRVDLNTRNNFLSTATRQESVYKLAEFLGYTPRRNVPAFGEMKVVSIKTNEAVIGSEGTSLGGKEIRYESANNVNNIDDFLTVMNSVLQSSNTFGSPKKQLVLDSIMTQFYDLNSTSNQIKFDITGYADGLSETFNIISVDYDNDNDIIIEKAPDPASSFGIYYKNDGRGLSSADTGFFVGVKQGALQFSDFEIETPIDNLTLDIDQNNINQTDIWVQTINSDASVVKKWTKVKDTNSENTTYNSIASGVRDIFSAKTRKNNQVSVQFPDKLFGNVPTDNIRVWYRTSINSSYVVRPDDLSNKKVIIEYVGLDGNVYSATLSVQLKKNIVTGSVSETLDSIRENAPKVYASQDRLITSEDYNSVLSAQVSGVMKVKSINRTFTGHSRYVDFNDPTGTYSSLDVFGKDGKLYKQSHLKTSSSSNGESAAVVFQKYIKPLPSDDELINLYYDKFRGLFETLKTTYAYDPTTLPQVWNTPSSSASTASSGYLQEENGVEVTRVGSSQTNYMQFVVPGALIKFKHVDLVTSDITYTWSKVVNVFADGLGIDKTGTQAGQASGLRSNGQGAITLDQIVKNGSTMEIIYPGFSRLFTTRESEIIVEYLAANKSFSLRYDYKNNSWELDNTPTFNSEIPEEMTDTDWLIYVEYMSEENSFQISTRTTSYFINSAKVSFSNINNELELDGYTRKAYRDSLNIFKYIGNTTETGTFYVYGYDADSDGITDSHTVTLSLVDADNDSRPENPDAFYELIGSETVTVDEEELSGDDELRFEWEHVSASNQVIDPSFTNIIDVYVLNTAYDTLYRNWLTTGKGTEPQAPTSYELSKQFININNKKAMSDSVIYKPVTYKPLFGPQASDELSARFRFIKLPNVTVTDNDIKTQCVTAINEFFAVNNWDFGETFYFTELAAYVHKKLVGLISSFVIVPQGTGSVFGDLFQITPEADEMFIPDVSLTDIDIILNITDANIRTGQ